MNQSTYENAAAAESARTFVGVFVLFEREFESKEELKSKLGNYQFVEMSIGQSFVVRDITRIEAVWIEPTENSKGRFWLRSPKLNAKIRRFISECAFQLESEYKVVVGRSPRANVLPPPLTSLQKQARDGGAVLKTLDWVNIFCSLLVFGIVGLSRQLQQMPWLVVPSCLLVLFGVFWVLTGPHPNRPKADRFFRGAQIYVMLIFSFAQIVAPLPLWAGAVVVSAFLLFVACIWWLSRRPMKGLSSTYSVNDAKVSLLVSQIEETDLIRSMHQEACLKCNYSLHGSTSCKCTECGMMNYYLIDRADAKELAIANGAIGLD